MVKAESAEILDRALQNYDAWRDALYPPGVTLTEHWRGKRDNMRGAIPTFTSAVEAVQWAQVNVNSGFNHRLVDDDMAVRKSEMLERRYPEFLDLIRGAEDVPFARPDTLARVGHRTVSNILFWHLEALLSSLRHLPSPRRVLEIGPGMGELARLFHQAIPDVEYVLVDLPESLFFAECYLGLACPEAMKGQVKDGSLPVAAFVFVPIQWRGAFPKVDLGISQGSFQEMPEGTVSIWMNALARVASALYSLNYRETPISRDGWTVVHEEQGPPVVAIDATYNFVELCMTRKATQP